MDDVQNLKEGTSIDLYVHTVSDASLKSHLMFSESEVFLLFLHFVSSSCL